MITTFGLNGYCFYLFYLQGEYLKYGYDYNDLLREITCGIVLLDVMNFL